jgi:hypothetical protein
MEHVASAQPARIVIGSAPFGKQRPKRAIQSKQTGKTVRKKKIVSLYAPCLDFILYRKNLCHLLFKNGCP